MLDTGTEKVGASAPAEPQLPRYEGIAVLGSHPETRKEAPFDKNWLIYACSPDNSPFGHSPHSQPLPRVDVCFELHIPIAHPTRPYRYLRWLEDLGVPVVMRDGDALPQFPHGVRYPDRELKERFGPFAFSSSVAYMIAKAIVDCEQMNIPKVGLWGIMQQSKTEWQQHMAGTKQMLWEAHKAGLEVVLPKAAEHLLHPPPEDW